MTFDSNEIKRKLNEKKKKIFFLAMSAASS